MPAAKSYRQFVEANTVLTLLEESSGLARSGWLTHPGRGVYMLPGDTLSRDGCLAFLLPPVSGRQQAGPPRKEGFARLNPAPV